VIDKWWDTRKESLAALRYAHKMFIDEPETLQDRITKMEVLFVVLEQIKRFHDDHESRLYRQLDAKARQIKLMPEHLRLGAGSLTNMWAQQYAEMMTNTEN